MLTIKQNYRKHRGGTPADWERRSISKGNDRPSDRSNDKDVAHKMN